MRDTIVQFMWGFQQHFRVKVEYEAKLVSMAAKLIDDNKECLPVASPKNVTDISTLGISFKLSPK